MDFGNFNFVAQWVIANGYWLMFLAMCVEGPIVTAAASFACALGIFNLPIVFILAFFGDVLPDALYYGIGLWGRSAIVNRFGRYFGLTEKRIKRIESLAAQHGGKTLVAIKLTPMAPFPGLMAIGAAKMRFQKFIGIIAAFTIPKVLFFMVLGFYFGQMYGTVIKYIKDGSIILLSALALIIIIYLFYNQVAAYFAKRVEKL